MLENKKHEATRKISKQIMEKWAVLTADQEEERSRLPLNVLLGEAVDLAEVVDRYFEDENAKGKVRLGLRSVLGRGAITENTAEEIRELQIAAGAAQAKYQVLVEKVSQAPVRDADKILDELRAALTFVLEDSGNEQGEEQLDRLRDAYSDAASHDGIAMALEGYAELAAQHLDALNGLGGFDPTWIDQAIQVARALRQRSADKLTGDIPQEQQDTLRLRNRLIGALIVRMRAARKAIRYVFRDYPDIAQKAGSVYLRSRQRARRKEGSVAPVSGVTTDVGSDEVAAEQGAGNA